MVNHNSPQGVSWRATRVVVRSLVRSAAVLLILGVISDDRGRSSSDGCQGCEKRMARVAPMQFVSQLASYRVPTAPDGMKITDAPTILEVRVLPSGVPCDITVLEAADKTLVSLFRSVIPEWRFKPPIGTETHITYCMRSHVLIYVRAGKHRPVVFIVAGLNEAEAARPLPPR